jgi:hypothetical protein
MALVVIGSAKAAPGVTTLTVALAAVSPGRTVAADLDPEGGDLALRYRALNGSPLDPETGLLSLAVTLRGDQSGPVRATGFRSVPPVRLETGAETGAADAAAGYGGPGPVENHLQTSAGGLEVLLGVNGPDQAVGLGPLWTPLGRALAETPGTVFADCGRIGPASPALPVIRQADAVILLARAEVEELAHLRERLRFLASAIGGRYPGPARLGVVLVASERDRSAGPRTEQLLRSSGLPVPVLGTMADDPRGAARLRGVGNGRAERTTLIRSVRALVPEVVALAGIVPQTVAPPEVAPVAVAPPTMEPPIAEPPILQPPATARAADPRRGRLTPSPPAGREETADEPAGRDGAKPGPAHQPALGADDPYADRPPGGEPAEPPEQPESSPERQRQQVREKYRERRARERRSASEGRTRGGTGWPGKVATASPAERRQ